MDLQCYGAAVLCCCNAMVLQCCGSAVLWCCSGIVLQSYGTEVLWTCLAMNMQCYGAAVLWICSAMVLQCFGSAVLLCCSAIVLQCYRSAVLLSSLCLDKQCIWVYELWVLHTYRHTEPILEVLADLKIVFTPPEGLPISSLLFVSRKPVRVSATDSLWLVKSYYTQITHPNPILSSSKRA